MVMLSLCPACVARGSHAAAAVPTVEIAPGVHLPMINDGVSNRSVWIAMGGTGLDTALSYGDNDQQGVGHSIRASGRPRSDFFVTTKVPCCPAMNFGWGWAHVCQNDGISAKNVTTDMAHNIQVLGLKPDLVLMHWPCDDPKDTAAAWAAMEEMVASGQTKAIGVSNFNSSALRALVQTAKIKPAANQCGFGVGHPNSATTWGSDNGTLTTCKELGVQYEAYSPLHGSGSFSVFKDPTVAKVAKAHGVSAAQVALRWVTQQGVVAVTSDSNPEYAKEDLSIFDFELTAAEMDELAALRG